MTTWATEGYTSWNIWLDPNEGITHPVWMAGVQVGDELRMSRTGKVVLENVLDYWDRLRAAGIDCSLHTFPGRICDCRTCTRAQRLASATLARKEGRMETYHMIMEALREA